MRKYYRLIETVVQYVYFEAESKEEAVAQWKEDGYVDGIQYDLAETLDVVFDYDYEQDASVEPMHAGDVLVSFPTE